MWPKRQSVLISLGIESTQRQTEGKSDQVLNREAVATQSPGLLCFGGYPGKRWTEVSNLEEVASFLFPAVYLAVLVGATPSGLDRSSVLSQGSRQSPANPGLWVATASRLRELNLELPEVCATRLAQPS